MISNIYVISVMMHTFSGGICCCCGCCWSEMLMKKGKDNSIIISWKVVTVLNTHLFIFLEILRISLNPQNLQALIVNLIWLWWYHRPEQFHLFETKMYIQFTLLCLFIISIDTGQYSNCPVVTVFYHVANGACIRLVDVRFFWNKLLFFSSSCLLRIQTLIR